MLRLWPSAAFLSALVFSLIWAAPRSPARADERAPETGAPPDVTLGANERAVAVDSLLADPSLPPEFRIFALEQLLRGHEDDEGAWVERAADALGRLYLGQGMSEEAARYLELALARRPDDADLLNTLGYLYADDNLELARAEELVRRALIAAPADAPEQVLGYYRDSLGWAFFRQGKLDSAVVHLELANRLAPGTPEIRGHLVDAYDALGRTDEATELLVDDLVAARGVDPTLRARLRRLHRTTPAGTPLPIEEEVARRVVARDVRELEAIEAAGGQVIRLEAYDGFPLVATLYRASGEAKAPAAILVPMFGGQRSDFEPLARALAQAGVNALTLDPRGHGASVTEEIYGPGSFVEDMPSYIHGAILDVMAARRYLGERSETQGKPLALIGASLGGFVAALAAADEAGVKALVLLSPGPAPPFTEAVTTDRHRPTLIVASADDPTAMAGAEVMIGGLDRARSEVLVFPGAVHGTALVTESEEVIPRIVRWLGGAFKDGRGL
jgi:alpha-beta hydrolase superfamily lysophospholipase